MLLVSINQPINQPIYQPTNQSTDQSVNQSINQSTNQPTNRSTIQSINQPMVIIPYDGASQSSHSHRITRPTTNQSIDHTKSINQPIDQPGNQLINHTINQRTHYLVNQHMATTNCLITTVARKSHGSHQSLSASINQSTTQPTTNQPSMANHLMTTTLLHHSVTVSSINRNSSQPTTQ